VQKSADFRYTTLHFTREQQRLFDAAEIGNHQLISSEAPSAMRRINSARSPGKARVSKMTHPKKFAGGRSAA
jgi:hypothetical protein